MGPPIVGRDEEQAEVDAALDALTRTPAARPAVVITGGPGCGRTTVWTHGVERARECGLVVVTARPTAAEAGLAHVVLADLLSELLVPGEADLLADLPRPQRRAVETVLLRGEPVPGDDAADLDPRAVATALGALLDARTAAAPVLLAVDDADRVDLSSAAALGFALRRRRGGVGVLAVAADTATIPWLPDPGAATTLLLRPLSGQDLHRMLADAGHPMPRPALARLERLSEGNPAVALALARAAGPGTDAALPGTLAEVVEGRLAALSPSVRAALLPVALAAAPTVSLLRRIDPTADAALEQAERAGVVDLEGDRVQLIPALLVDGIPAAASPADRRAAHRALAAAVTDAEQRARHAARGALGADPAVVADLDIAARTARRRGAPAVAAELLELAVGLGGDTAARRTLLADHHLDAGEPARARATLETVLATGSGTAQERAAARRLLAVVRLHDDSYAEAAVLLTEALAELAAEPGGTGDRGLEVRVRSELAFVTVNLGSIADAHAMLDELLAVAAQEVEPGLRAVALATATMVRFLHGDGLDEAMLERALALEDPAVTGPVMTRPTLIRALVLAWTGEVDVAHEVFTTLRTHSLERGAEADLLFPAFHHVVLECWRGDLTEADRIAADTRERAEQLGGEVPRAIALAVTSCAAAYAGREDEARRDAQGALEVLMRGSCVAATVWPMITLGFLEVSRGDHEAAVAVLGPLAAAAGAMGYGEPLAAPFVPDAAEALVAVGRLEEARDPVAALEQAGRRLDRPWAQALGGRCRALLRAAEGDLEGAAEAAVEALARHDRLPIPFERARTLMVLGGIQRRRRRRGEAATALTDAVTIFDEIGTPLWARRARAELDRVAVARHTGNGASTDLTAAESRVARLAAAGRTNRDVAAALGVSPKTVEATLVRVYRKLGIRSRAELGARLGAGPAPRTG